MSKRIGLLRSQCVLGWLFFLIALAACAPVSAPRADTGDAEAQPVTLKIGALPSASFAATQIGIEEGYFAEQGIDLEVVPLRSANEILPLLLDGQLDVGQVAVSAGFFNAVAGGGTVRMVLPSTTISVRECAYAAYFVRLEDFEAGVYAEPAAWRGARVALPPPGPTSVSGYILERYLQQGGLTLADVELPVVDLAVQPDALRAGQVNIVLAFEPAVARLLAADDLALLSSAETMTPGHTAAAIVFGERLLADRDLGNRYATAFLKAVRQYREGATPRNVELLAALTGDDPSLIERFCLADIPADGRIEPAPLADFQAWLMDQGLVNGLLDFEAFVDPGFADEANRVLGAAE